jgi:hypothetical protein
MMGGQQSSTIEVTDTTCARTDRGRVPVIMPSGNPTSRQDSASPPDAPLQHAAMTSPQLAGRIATTRQDRCHQPPSQ